MLTNLSIDDISFSDAFIYDENAAIHYNDASVHIYDCPNGGTCTILDSSSGWKYQLLKVIKTSIFGMVVRGQIVGTPSSAASTSSSSRFLKDLVIKPPHQGEMIAIKIYSRKKIDEICLSNVKEDPIAEIAILQHLQDNHPNVLSQYECCADQENIYSIMPLLSGSELFDAVVDQRHLSELQSRIIFRQMVEGLQSLHRQGIAHQDMSLENILYDARTQRAVIIDFGLAIQCHSKSEPVINTRSGKLFYMSPEVMSGKPTIDPFVSDVWSLGICLLYMLLGFPPIERACADDVRFQYLRDGRLRELLQHWEVLHLSELVLDIIQQMLCVSTQDRVSVDNLLRHPWLQEKQPLQAPTVSSSAVSPTSIAVVFSEFQQDGEEEVISFQRDRFHVKQHVSKG